MSKQENLNNPEDIQETSEQGEMDRELKQMAENVESIEQQQNEKPAEAEDSKKGGISRRKFLGNMLKTAAGIAIGSSVLGRGAEVMAGEKEEKESREAQGLIKDLYNLPNSPLAETESQQRHAKMQAADRKIRVFALQRKLGFPKARTIQGDVLPKDMQETMGVLGKNLEYMIDSKFNYERKKDKTRSDQELKKKIRKEIYDHPGIMKLRSLMETYSDN